MPHNLHDKNPAMRRSRRMDTVNRLRSNVYCTVETKGHLRPPQVIVNGFWKGNNVQPLFPQEVCCFLASVSSQNNQTFQLQLPVGVLHGLYFIQTIFIRHTHQLKRLPGRSQDRPPLGQDSGKIR